MRVLCRGCALYRPGLAAAPQPVVELVLGCAGASGDELAGVHRAGTDLAFVATGRQQQAAVDVRGQALVVDQDAVGAQHMRDEVVGEDRQPVQVLEAHDAGESQVRRHDLRALVEPAIGEQRHAACQLRRESLRRSARRARNVERVALTEEPAELAQRLREQGHQLVIGALAERVGDLLGAHRAQLRRRPRSMRAEAIGERPRDGEVARRAAALAQRGKPSRAEVQRVERQEVRGDLARRAFEVVAQRVDRGRRAGFDVRERIEVDAHRLGRRRDPCARRADLVADAGLHVRCRLLSGARR